jgi:hypothetical protein
MSNFAMQGGGAQEGIDNVQHRSGADRWLAFARRGRSPRPFDVIPCSGRFTEVMTMDREMDMTHRLEKAGRR